MKRDFKIEFVVRYGEDRTAQRIDDEHGTLAQRSGDDWYVKDGTRLVSVAGRTDDDLEVVVRFRAGAVKRGFDLSDVKRGF